ncbi:MAG: NAD(P)/FAD-dependent oxidoreductase [Candidatus Omnitrophota bacterium]
MVKGLPQNKIDYLPEVILERDKERRRLRTPCGTEAMSDAVAAQTSGSPIFGSLRRCSSAMCHSGHRAFLAPCTDLKSGTSNNQFYSAATPEVEITIIGAGVVGLAVAAELSRPYHNVVVLERHETFGQETSSRNSEVIHSGIYYPTGSWKAKMCVEGARLLYEYCERYNIPCAKPGKLIVATGESEIPFLEEISHRGKESGVEGLRFLEQKEINRVEPKVKGVAAILSPETGIIDSHTLMKRLYAMAQTAGVLFSFNSEVVAINRENEGYIIGIKEDNYTFSTRILINSAGLSADTIAGLAGIDCGQAGYRLRYCKGSYFSYQGISPVKRLVYPVPQEDLSGLGVHSTVDLAGRLRFGPDTEYVDKIDYSVDADKKSSFYRKASRLIAGLDEEAFRPDMAGIRPRIQGDGFRDFIIRDEADRGLPGFINLIGIESPGLTSVFSIARQVHLMVK